MKNPDLAAEQFEQPLPVRFPQSELPLVVPEIPIKEEGVGTRRLRLALLNAGLDKVGLPHTRGQHRRTENALLALPSAGSHQVQHELAVFVILHVKLILQDFFEDRDDNTLRLPAFEDTSLSRRAWHLPLQFSS